MTYKQILINAGCIDVRWMVGWMKERREGMGRGGGREEAWKLLP